MCYKLDENMNAVPCEFYELAAGSRYQILTTIGEVRISTIFLTIDHSFNDGPPVLWETMIFGGANSDEQWRYCTYEEAKLGHEKAVALVVQEFPTLPVTQIERQYTR